ncbi:glutathione S-transferase [Burkholderiaceae bacterium DAT-1]|nr:glutathione S-transferase [Burkholderiaceae bacterium DAT-1]
MKLIASLTSPYARKVRIALIEKRIECPLEVDIPWEATTHVPEHNPLGKVPVLVFDDGNTLFDSRVIVEYLDAISPVNQLIPKDHRPAIAVKRWEALADGICDAAVAVFLERKRPETLRSESWIERQLSKVNAGLAAMSRDLDDKPWCNGESFTLADIAVGMCLGYLNLRFSEINWAEQYPNLARHYEKLMQRPAFIETQPPSN